MEKGKQPKHVSEYFAGAGMEHESTDAVYDGLQARGRAMEKVMDEEVASDQRQALKRGVGDGSAPRAKTARK